MNRTDIFTQARGELIVSGYSGAMTDKPSMQFPRLLPVRQLFPDRAIADVALGVGRRGIANLPVIVVDYWKSQGCQPFIFPAMGSHGAATAIGQAELLSHFGLHNTITPKDRLSVLPSISQAAVAVGHGIGLPFPNLLRQQSAGPVCAAATLSEPGSDIGLIHSPACDTISGVSK